MQNKIRWVAGERSAPQKLELLSFSVSAMASITVMLVRPNLIPSSSDMVSLPLRRSLPPTAIRFRRSKKSTSYQPFSLSVSASLQALIFDCDGVILESEHLHRQAYNDAFAHFDVRCPNSTSEPLNWSIEFYDDLQNRIGGGKPKMRWYSSLFIITLTLKFV